MAGGQNDSRVTEPALPALAPDGLDAVVFDTDGVAGFLRTTPFPTSVAFVRRLRERGLRTAVVSATGRGGP